MRLASFLRYCFPKTIRNAYISLKHNCSIHPSAYILGDVDIGRKTEIFPGVILKTISGKIKLGDNCAINSYSLILATQSEVKIGNDVLIGPGCVITSFDHGFERKDIPIRCQKVVGNDVSIGDDVWIGCGVKILKGVHIGKGSVVGAGSVVTKSIPDFSVVAGVPAKVIKKR